MEAVNEYIKAIEKELAAGNATEPSHYPALKTLIQGLAAGVTATSNPKRIECGAPDFIVTKGVTMIGCIEAKDIDKSLDEVEKSEQLKRYRHSLSNLVLTDYLEFRWYEKGERRLSARLGTKAKEGKIKRDKAGIQVVTELLTVFLSHQVEAIGTPRELALRMAQLAHLIRNLIVNAVEKEPETGSLHAQLSAFRDNLIPDLAVEQFADMYAQTIAYGLFAARCTSPDSKGFTRQNAAYLLPKTNPFLRKLFNDIAGPNLDDRIAWLVDDLAQVLAQADMAAVLHDFGKHTGKEDPVVHFYETFLTAYDPKVREMRGVYYTPEPVVSYIVRSIDHLLKTRFNRPQGLADANTLILDPAVGTATFLYMAINEIHDAIIAQGQKGLWNDYVAEKLLPRLFGFELLMAPYAVAHLKLGLLLQETGYEFPTDQRLGIYLTNTLEEAFKKSELLPGFNKYIVDEANAAAEIKKEKPIMVVLGNPPYSGVSANKGKWISDLIEDYKIIDGHPLNERKHWLQDDYVKFIRFGQWRIHSTGQGILAFISNHAYLNNPTFRGMRQSLLNTFTDIYILNLHGSTGQKETTPEGGKDENVFDIQQGVAIGIFIKAENKTRPCAVHYADLWGLREQKYLTLLQAYIADTHWEELQPNSPFYFFVPIQEKLRPEYETGWKMTDVLPINVSGIVTARDEFIVDFEPEPIRKRIESFIDKSVSDDEVKDRFNLSENYAWRVSEARKQLMEVKNWDSLFADMLYRPFDVRSIYYHPSVVWRTRINVMRHMLAGKNIGLIAMREVAVNQPYSHFLATRSMVDNRAFYSNKGIQYLFPLYLYPAEGEMQFKAGRRPNLNPEFITVFSAKLGLKFVEDGKGDLKESFGPEDVFNYAYAVFHAPAYRSRYAEFLKIDFPRLPLTSNKELFKALAVKGAELVPLHLMESPALNNLITTYPVSDSNTVERVGYDDNNQRVYINKTQYFEGVPPEVWNFHIGGYQVCEKWLKDRQKVKRKLTIDEAQHYQKVVVAIKETIRLMAEIDALIPGWPIE
ncbi:MAG: type ISP restriction/modification enzyme [Chloroflexota bacterium]